MTTRIFISYRSADGMDKATALARDLGQVFGDGAVFLDKDDLRGGSTWRAEIGRVFDHRPVLLLLLTPQLIEAVGADGQLRIKDPADPVRRELEVALEAGAHVIPVLCDGLATVPDAAHLPAPFHLIGELTWRKLRAYDWAHDVERLVLDLRAAGVPDPATAAIDPGAAPPTPKRRPAWAVPVAAGAAVLVLAGAAWLLRKAPAAEASVSVAPAPLAGRWSARLSHGEAAVLVLAQTGDSVTLASEPIPVAGRDDWVRYREFWRESTGRDLQAVMYRGAGRVVADPGLPLAIDIALQVQPSPASGTDIDSGNLSARLSPDGQRMIGTLWLNSEQVEQPVTLAR